MHHSEEGVRKAALHSLWLAREAVIADAWLKLIQRIAAEDVLLDAATLVSSTVDPEGRIGDIIAFVEAMKQSIISRMVPVPTGSTLWGECHMRGATLCALGVC